jgi:hypothetical protein
MGWDHARFFRQKNTPFDLSRTDKCRRQRGIGKHQVFRGASIIYMLYKVGDRTEPWGTSARISLGIDISPSTETLNLLRERKELMSWIKLVENSNLDNLYSKPDCHAVSKAFLTSKNTAAIDILLLKLRARCPLSSYIAVSCCDVHGSQICLR